MYYFNSGSKFLRFLSDLPTWYDVEVAKINSANWKSGRFYKL